MEVKGYKFIYKVEVGLYLVYYITDNLKVYKVKYCNDYIDFIYVGVMFHVDMLSNIFESSSNVYEYEKYNI